MNGSRVFLAVTTTLVVGCGGGEAGVVGGTSTTSGPGGDAAACTAPLVQCPTGCVAVLLDPDNCGGCGKACAEGQVCSGGNCGMECTGGTTKCGDLCVAVDNDPKNCGACDKVCAEGEVCSGGKCAWDCTGGSTKCGDGCVDVTKDPAHCGNCATQCPEGEVCSNGLCSLNCAGGSTKCGDLCIEVATDPANCGACGKACVADEICSGGACALLCSGGTTKCGSKCVDLATDPANCGYCGKGCDAGLVCSSGVCALQCTGGSTKCGNLCVDLAKDAQNCGFCGKACEKGEACATGVCSLVCAGGTTKCGSMCADVTKDPANCGSCGKACVGEEVCSNGACGLNCVGGASKCGLKCVDLAKDPANCGSCGKACTGEEVCSNGACALVCGGGATKCGSKCVDLANDPANCGFCGKACAGDEVCANGTCGLKCVGGTTKCGNGCTNLNVDANNCGVCNKVCAGGESCCTGKCVLACGGCGNVCGQGESCCGGQCKSVSTPQNCGGCGITCAAGQSCCGGKCVDQLQDAANCGACGNACAQGENCCAGKCGKANQATLCIDCAKACKTQEVSGGALANGTVSGSATVEQNAVQTYTNKPVATPYMWIAMHNSNIINKVDAADGKLIGTYPSGGGGPSRTVVALDGNFWIAHRCDWDPNNGNCSNVVKMAADGSQSCIIKNAADNATLPFVRALGADGQGYIWAGTWNDARAHKIDPELCKVVLDVSLPSNPYGFATDSKGLMWNSQLGSGPYGAIDTLTGKVKYSVPNQGTTAYGVAIDTKDNAYLGQWGPCSGGLYRIDGQSQALSAISPNNPGGGCTRGTTIDTDGNLWTAYWTGGAPSNASKFSGQNGSGTFLSTYAIGQICGGVGMAGDSSGKIWFTGTCSNNVVRINKDSGAVELTTALPGSNPYNYSDWSGIMLRTRATNNGQYGTYTIAFNGGQSNATWGSVTWDAKLPQGALVRVYVRSAALVQQLASAPLCGPFTTSPADITGCPNISPKQWLEVRAVLVAKDAQNPPVVSKIQANYQN